MVDRKDEEPPDLFVGEVPPQPTRAEVAAVRLLTQVAVVLLRQVRADRFPTEERELEQLIEAGRSVEPEFIRISSGADWPRSLVGRVAVVVAEDGTALTLITEMVRAHAFPGEMKPADALPEPETLTITSAGEVEFEGGELTRRLLAVTSRKRRST